MKMSGNFGKIFFVLITIVAVAGVNIFVINQGLKAKIDAPFRVYEEEDRKFGGTVTGMYYYSESGEKKTNSTLHINEVHLGGFDYTVGAGDVVNEVYIIIKNSEEEKCFIVNEKTWPAIEFFYEGASNTIRVGNKVLVYYDEAEERNLIVSINDNRTREQEMEIIKKQLGNIVWTIILSMAGVDIALVLFFLCLYKLINFDGSGEQKENKVVLIVMTVFFAFASVAMTTSKVIRTNLTETAIETTQQLGLHDGE